MKKLLFLTLFFSVTLVGHTQEPPARTLTQSNTSSYIYCKIVGSPKTNNKIEVIIDFGQERNRWRTEKLRDENGRPIEFNSMIDAMNRMSTDGWEFVQAYVVSNEGTSTVHWLLKRNINTLSEEEKADILSKLRTR